MVTGDCYTIGYKRWYLYYIPLLRVISKHIKCQYSVQNTGHTAPLAPFIDHNKMTSLCF